MVGSSDYFNPISFVTNSNDFHRTLAVMIPQRYNYFDESYQVTLMTDWGFQSYQNSQN